MGKLQPQNPLILKEKGDISVALSTFAPLTAESCSQITSYLQSQSTHFQPS